MLVVAEGSEHQRHVDVDIVDIIMDDAKFYFKEKGSDISTKYFAPTYQLRAILTMTCKNVLCILFTNAAVPEAYVGLTGFSRGPFNEINVLIPL